MPTDEFFRAATRVLEGRRDTSHCRRHRFSFDVNSTELAAVPLAAVLALSFALPARAGGGKVKLARRYRAGQSMVYLTHMQTHATIHATPEGLKAFLPPIPTELEARQQNTVTVRTVHPEGGADVETRFDSFDLHSDVTDRAVENDPPSATPSAQGARAAEATQVQAFSRGVAGQTLTAHFDPQGQLLSFEGAESMLGQVDAPLREPLRQVIKFYLEQMNGNSLYPDHEVKPGEEWKKNLASPASDAFPFAVEGESSLRYAGKTKYQKVNAAIVDYHFTNALKPALDKLRQTGPLAPLEAMGLSLDLGVNGQGRALVALDDGRILQNRSTLHQTLTAQLKSRPGQSPAKPETLTVQVDSNTTLEVDGK